MGSSVKISTDARSAPEAVRMQDVTPVVEIEAELADLIPQYLSNRRADLHAAQDMLVEGDFRAIARLAHRIRGSAASYGFGQLGDIAFSLP